MGSGSLTIHLGWFVLPALMPTIIEDLQITATRGGLALSVLTFMAALSRYPGGRLADQLSRKTVLAFSLSTALLGFVTLAGATSYPMLLGGVALAGVGLGTYVPAGVAQISDLFERKQGRAFGLNNAASNVGGVLASGLAIVILGIGPWRMAFLPLLPILLTLLLLQHLWNDDVYRLRRPNLEFRQSISRALGEPRIRSIIIVAALFVFVWNGSISFLPVLLETERGLAPETANLAFAGVFVVGAVVAPLSGAIGDRIGALATMFLMICLAMVGLGTILAAPTRVSIFLGVLVFAVGISGYIPVVTSYMMSIFPKANKGGDYGLIGALNMGVGSIGPTYVGVVSDHLHYSAAYVGLIVCLVVCLAIVSWLRYR